MRARRRPSRAIQRLQGEKRYRPLETQRESSNMGWFISVAKYWHTKNAIVVSILSCGKLLGETHLQRAKPFLSWISLPHQGTHFQILSAGQKLLGSTNFLLFVIAKKQHPDQGSLVQNINFPASAGDSSMIGMLIQIQDPTKTSGSKQPIRFALLDFRNQDVRL